MCESHLSGQAHHSLAFAMSGLGYTGAQDGGSKQDWRVTVEPRSRRPVYQNVVTGAVTYFKPDVLKSSVELSRDRNRGHGWRTLITEREKQALV